MQTPTPAPDAALDSLEGLLTHFDQSALAHAPEEFSAEEKSSLAAFAAGELDEPDSKVLIPLLAHNTTALAYLAGLLKAPPSGRQD